MRPGRLSVAVRVYSTAGSGYSTASFLKFSGPFLISRWLGAIGFKKSLFLYIFDAPLADFQLFLDAGAADLV